MQRVVSYPRQSLSIRREEYPMKNFLAKDLLGGLAPVAAVGNIGAFVGKLGGKSASRDANVSAACARWLTLTACIALWPAVGRATVITIPFTIVNNAPVIQIVIGTTTINAVVDTGFNDRLMVSNAIATALALPNQGAVGGRGVGGALAAMNTTLPAGTVTGIGGQTANFSLPVAGPGVISPTLPVNALVGVDFFNTDPAGRGSVNVNFATTTISVRDNAQARAQAALNLSTDLQLATAGSIFVPSGTVAYATNASVAFGTNLLTESLVLSPEVTSTLISSETAAALGIPTTGMTETFMSALGTFTVPSAMVNLDLFPSQGPLSIMVGILPDNLDPDHINVVGADVLTRYSELEFNVPNGTFSATTVPEPGGFQLVIIGIGIILSARHRGEFTRRRRLRQ
jgi:hypothetical protein